MHARLAIVSLGGNGKHIVLNVIPSTRNEQNAEIQCALHFVAKIDAIFWVTHL